MLLFLLLLQWAVCVGSEWCFVSAAAWTVYTVRKFSERLLALLVLLCLKLSEPLLDQPLLELDALTLRLLCQLRELELYLVSLVVEAGVAKRLALLHHVAHRIERKVRRRR